MIGDAKSGEIKHERTGEFAKPIFPYPVARTTDRYESPTDVARWITSANNPYFAKSYVNRI